MPYIIPNFGPRGLWDPRSIDWNPDPLSKRRISKDSDGNPLESWSLMDEEIKLTNNFNLVLPFKANSQSFPHYNLIKVSKTCTRMEFALAGFKSEDISIEVKENVLTVSGESSDKSDTVYYHKGISNRSFNKKFQLKEHSEVSNATMQDGVLSLDINYNEPEDKKSKKININNKF